MQLTVCFCPPLTLAPLTLLMLMLLLLMLALLRALTQQRAAS
jgi:hypothetical protein